MHGLGPLPGDLVWIRRRRWRVERVLRDRRVVRLDVALRDRRLTFLSPFDRALAATGRASPRRVRPQQALARLACLVSRADDLRVPSSALTAAVGLLPYQLEPAMAMLAGRARLLIADEVGLGKTVQAGFVIAELLRRDPALRGLVLVPAALREQWIDELERRFQIPCLAADREGLDALSRAIAFGESPWRQPGIWIASPDFLKQRHVAESLPRDPWDVVVVDEAHAVCGHSERYELVRQTAARSRRVMLLTATPHGGDEARFARLVSLGEAGPAGAEAIAVFRRTRAALGDRPPRRVRWHSVGLSPGETAALAALRDFERAVAARAGHDDRPLLLLSVFRKRALSTMAAWSRSLGRRLAWLGGAGPDAALEWSQPRLEFEDEGDLVDREERDGLTAHTGLGNRQERSWLRRLRTLADEASHDESKVERLARVIERTAEPVVVFTEFRDSLDVVCRRLALSRAIAILHGGQDRAERRRQLGRFLDGAASVLVATDVAGQGLNLQARARWVISLELPWNPTRLEQRIGRVDRILQARPTHFTLLVARDEAESGLLAHLSRRILAAQRAFGDDALAGVTPPEPAVRAALLSGAGAPLPAPRAAPVPTCRRWERLARRAARELARRRRLAAEWRAPDPSAGRPLRSDHPRASRLVPPGYHTLAVLSVPILDAGESVLERRVVAVAAGAGVPDARDCRALAAALRPQVLGAVSSRVAAAARRAGRAAEAAAVRDRALVQAQSDERRHDEAQPGLFDGRESRAFDARAEDAARTRAAIERRLARHRLAAGVHAGEPVLEVVLVARR